MSRTFEEIAGEELDTLYQGALFLSGGHPAAAERLLVEAVSLAFKERSRDTEPEAIRKWLEVRLVRSFLRHVEGAPSQLDRELVERAGFEVARLSSLGSEELFAAAGAVPGWPRAALWLVMLRRWSYQEAAGAMGVDAESMDGLLGYRDMLLSHMLASSRRGRTGMGPN